MVTEYYDIYIGFDEGMNQQQIMNNFKKNHICQNRRLMRSYLLNKLKVILIEMKAPPPILSMIFC